MRGDPRDQRQPQNAFLPSTAQNLLNCLVACGALIATGCNSGDQTAPWPARVERIVGEARYTSNNGADWAAVATGTILSEGSVVQTALGDRNYVDLVLGDGTRKDGTPGKTAKADRDRVRLHGDTVLGIDQRAARSAGPGWSMQTQLDLRKGRITGRVKHLEAGSAYEIRYPRGVTGFRESGVVYDMRWADRLSDGETNPPCVLSLLSGAAVFVPAGTNANPTVIPAGFTFDDRTAALTPLSEPARKELAATVDSLP